MGRLKAIQTRLKPIGTRLKPAITREESEVQRDKDRNKTQPWRRWYRTKPWDRLRDEILARDAYMCQQTGVLCIGKYPAPNNLVVDHMKPHHGNAALFWDRENLQTVSKEHQDKQKQAEERRASGRFCRLVGGGSKYGRGATREPASPAFGDFFPLAVILSR